MRFGSSYFAAAAAMLVAFCVAGCAMTSARTARMTRFEFTSPMKRVLLVDPDVQLGELTADGNFERRADWTMAAQGFIVGDIQGHFAKSGAEMVLPQQATPREVQLIKLHGRVGRSIMVHLFAQGAGGSLPNKGDALDWTLGPGTNELRMRYGADYALFVYVHDSYASAGRRAVQVLGALARIEVSGGEQLGFVSLVDLRTGNIVWFNRLDSQYGDLRTAGSAQATVDALIKGIPL
jgi:hypothetical protein